MLQILLFSLAHFTLIEWFGAGVLAWLLHRQTRRIRILFKYLFVFLLLDQFPQFLLYLLRHRDVQVTILTWAFLRIQAVSAYPEGPHGIPTASNHHSYHAASIGQRIVQRVLVQNDFRMGLGVLLKFLKHFGTRNQWPLNFFFNWSL